MSAQQAGYWLWGAFYVTWWIPALWAAKTTARPARGAQMADRLLGMIGAILLFAVPVDGSRRIAAMAPLWRAPAWVDWSFVALIAAAFAFCWWARVHLGRLWSGLVTVKADHRIVDTGPYGLVRHPIYSGVIVAFLGLGLLRASPAALLGVAVLTVGFWMTARKEERFLRQALGQQAYDDYSRRTPMLAPFLR
jgi:protein-S-isoprenylcysteine O-methyltransferase Ste14